MPCGRESWTLHAAGGAAGLRGPGHSDDMRILFLSTWFPYPPDQGCKIRAYHLLRALAENHETVLVSFQDCPIQPAWLEHLEQCCTRVEIVQRNPFHAGLAGSVRGWLSLRPSSVVATYSGEMAEKVRTIASEWRPDRIVALTYVAAPYALLAGNAAGHSARVIDIDNLMARMLREACERAAGRAARARRWLAWRKFLRYEQRLYSRFDLSVTVTEDDRQSLLQLLDGRSGQVGVAANGVDTRHHQPGISQPQVNTLVYNGALGYSANYEAMKYFIHRILPSIVAQIPGARLCITGKTGGVDLGGLHPDGHVTFTGYLDDIRPAIASSWVCVVPLLSGGGTRLKILEAMALGTTVVSTSKGAEGLEAVNGRHLLIADTPESFAEQTVRLLRDPELRSGLALNARRLVEEKYEWSTIRRNFRELVEQCRPPQKGSGT